VIGIMSSDCGRPSRKPCLPSNATPAVKAEAAYWLGVLMLVAAALTAWSGPGIVIGAFVPLPFSLAAALRPSRLRIALALAFWGAWFLALYYVLT